MPGSYSSYNELGQCFANWEEDLICGRGLDQRAHGLTVMKHRSAFQKCILSWSQRQARLSNRLPQGSSQEDWTISYQPFRQSLNFILKQLFDSYIHSKDTVLQDSLPSYWHGLCYCGPQGTSLYFTVLKHKFGGLKTFNQVTQITLPWQVGPFIIY